MKFKEGDILVNLGEELMGVEKDFTFLYYLPREQWRPNYGGHMNAVARYDGTVGDIDTRYFWYKKGRHVLVEEFLDLRDNDYGEEDV